MKYTRTMTVKVYRKRPQEEPDSTGSLLTFRIDPELVTRGELEYQHRAAAWGACRCPRHRDAGGGGEVA
ncbi:hypothetical protein [Streptomyces buecherae]|uniref:Uncharacterized protein n=1 Tax=Streptomyces buecherae TaxID=2763006 RepID=A0A7H8N7S7_9ACTN|nr:hypothetical protein [Streptomyces buecherae]QKW50479.1 hypothetical protein HUT08_14130 [Streptomyces buecherae]